MIPEIPVTTAGELYIWPHGNKPAIWLKRAKNLLKCAAQGVFIRQVLEKIARKYYVQFFLIYRPRCRAILAQKCHVGREVFFSSGIEIHAEFFSGANCVDELAVAAAEVQNYSIFRHKFLEKAANQHRPNALPVRFAGIESVCVDLA